MGLRTRVRNPFSFFKTKTVFTDTLSLMLARYWKQIAVVVLLIVLPIAYYGIMPLFITIEMNERLPETPDTRVSSAVPIVDTLAHPAKGTVRIVETPDTSFIRYENFKTINGPDLFIYLAKDLDAKEFVNLGPLKATEGNVNYEIPEGVDVHDYRYVLTWCKQFGVLFNSADIGSISPSP
jgi:hypothetical protein